MLTEREEFLCNAIEETAIKIHQQTGPGLFESAYQSCLVYELNQMGIDTEVQKEVRVFYDDEPLDLVLKTDVLVGGLVVCEIESEEVQDPIWKAKALTCMKFSGARVGYVLNFNVVSMKEGISRYGLDC